MSLKSLNVRLAALFSLIFFVASTLLFGVAYFFQHNTLVQDDRRNLEARTLEFWALYQSGGAVAVQRALTIETFLSDYNPFLLRIASSTNRTLALYHPPAWDSYEISDLEETHPGTAAGAIHVPSSAGPAYLDILTIELPDGNLLQVGTSSAARQSLLRRFRTIYILALIPIVGLSFAGGIIFSNRSLRPIKRLIGLTRSIIETGNMNERLPQSGRGDELDELTALFNRMLGQIETLIQGMRTSLDNVAHDLRTPMTRLRHKIEAGAVEEALEESDNIQSMLRALMDISEAESGVMKLNKKPVNLSDLVSDIVEFYSYTGDESGLVIASHAGEPVTAEVDIDRMRQVLTNLLDNAVKYTPRGGAVTVEVRYEGTKAVFTVSDTGIGISKDDLPHIWDRLFRGDRSRTAPGLGLGLGLVKAIVEAHGGSVRVESRPGSGSTFTVILPANITKL